MTLTIPLYTQDGTQKGTLPVQEIFFGAKVDRGLIHRLLVLQQANARYPLAHTKTKAEVRGGGKKPWMQKHTGRARQGSIRNPHWRGGGVSFGPRNDRNFKITMPKKERRKALFSMLSAKLKDDAIFALEGYEAKEPKTKPFAALLKKLPIKKSVLIVLPEKNAIVEKSVRNIPYTKTILASYLNILDLLKHNKVLFFAQAVKKMDDIF